MTAREALRAARETLECSRLPGGSMVIMSCALADARHGGDPYDVGNCDDMKGSRDERHRWAASALLDGFSIEEVTNAGG